MNIAKALKVKNRLVGELAKIQEIWQRENSRLADSPSKIDVADIANQYEKALNKVISIKTAISEASAPIALELVSLAELKGKINFINSLPCREGSEDQYSGRDTLKTVTWKAYVNQETKDKMVADIQGRINDTQDTIDAFNASTLIRELEF